MTKGNRVNAELRRGFGCAGRETQGMRKCRVLHAVCRLEVGDTAGWKPALLPKAIARHWLKWSRFKSIK